MIFKIGDHVAKRGETMTVRVSDLSDQLDGLGLGDFSLELRHIPKKRLNKISERHTRKVRNRGGGMVDKLNRVPFFREFIEETLLGWDGFTVGVLKRMVALENLPAGITDDTVIPFSVDQAIDLFDASYHLELAVGEFVTEPGNFIPATDDGGAHEIETGN